MQLIHGMFRLTCQLVPDGTQSFNCISRFVYIIEWILVFYLFIFLTINIYRFTERYYLKKVMELCKNLYNIHVEVNFLPVENFIYSPFYNFLSKNNIGRY